MYQENKSTTNLVKSGLCVIITILVVLLSAKLINIIITNNKDKNASKYMTTELEKLNDVAKDYYKEDILPKESGSVVKTSLKELIDNKLIEEIKDVNGDSCNMEESYISVIKLDKEYQYKSYLVCGSETNYLNSFKKIEVKEEPKTEVITTTKPVTTTTKKTTTTVKTTKAVTTTVKTTKDNRLIVSFNSNGGSMVSNQAVPYGSYARNITPVRNGYVFMGWYYHGELYDFNRPVVENIVLTAKWRVQ